MIRILISRGFDKSNKGTNKRVRQSSKEIDLKSNTVAAHCYVLAILNLV